jgi:hypothetical protein
MDVAKVSIEMLQLLINQIESNSATSNLLGVLASRIDPEGKDEQLKAAFIAVTEANSVVIKQMQEAITIAKGKING